MIEKDGHNKCNRIKTTVIIPNYNGIHYLENCLHSLAGEPACIIVVDNGSTDGSYEIAKKIEAERLPQIKTIRFPENTGFCHAVNAGIVSASTEYVLFLNNDTVAEPGFVRELEKAVEKSGDIFSASAKMLSMREKDRIDDAGDLYCALGWAFAIGKGRPEQAYQDSYDIFASCGGASIFRKNVLDKIGLLDENHFAYLEDIDLGYRSLLYGYRNVFAPKARVYHAGSASSGSRYNKFKVDLSSRNSIYLICKNMPFWQILLNLPFLLAGFGIKIIFFQRKGFGRDYLRGLYRGFLLSVSADGRKHKVGWRDVRFGAYCRVQLYLWINVIRRFFG